MRKIGSKLRNLMYAVPIALSIAGGVKGQENPAGLFVPSNENGVELLNRHNKEQRDDLTQIVLNGDWVSEVPPTTPSDTYDWDCTNYTQQLLTNNWNWGENINLYKGYKGDPIQDSLYIYEGTLRDMGKEGLPFMWAFIPNGKGHDMVAILTGDDATKWEDWNFVEPQFDQMNVQPGQAYMPENCEIIIKYPIVKENDIQGKYLEFTPVQKFVIENGVPRNTGYINPEMDFILQRDKDAPVINKEQNNYQVLDDNLRNVWYDNGNGEKVPISASGAINPNWFQTDTITLGGEDLFYNKTERKIAREPTNALEREVLNSNVKVYPNPAKDYLKFDSESDKEANVTMYSIDGKEVGKEYDFNGDVNMDVSNYSPGIYLYKYENSDGVKTGKVVIK